MSASPIAAADSADDDVISANRVNNFPSAEDELVPAALAQLIENRSRSRMSKENPGSVVNAESDPDRGVWITSRDISNDRF